MFIIWLKRLITPLGRIVILQSLILSKLVHLWLLLLDPPDTFIEDLQKIIFRFVWNRKRDRIIRDTAVKYIADGSLSIPQIESFMNAQKLTWIRKLKPTNHRWKQIACQMYQDLDNMDMYGPSIYSKEVHSNRFWEDTFKVCELFRYKVKPESSEEALVEPLFLNRNIKVGKKCILFKKLVRERCLLHRPCVNVTDEEGWFYKYNEFTKKYNIQVNYLEYFGCVQVIKTYLKSLKIITESNEMEIPDH